MGNSMTARMITVLVCATIATPVVPGSAAAKAGYCGGSFHDPVVVNGFLEWGATDTCTGNTASWYPHSISVQLQARDAHGYTTVRDVGSSYRDHGLATVNVFSHNDVCRSSASTRYQMRASVPRGHIELVGALAREHRELRTSVAERVEARAPGMRTRHSGHPVLT